MKRFKKQTKFKVNFLMAKRCQMADGCQNVSIIKPRNFQFENIGNFFQNFCNSTWYYLVLLSDSDSTFA